MISSTVNKQVKYVNALMKKAKTRREEGLFVAEGSRLVSEIPSEQLHAVYVSESFLKNKSNRSLLEGFSRVETVSDEVFRAMSDTQAPQGILALAKQRRYGLREVLAADPGPALLLFLEAIRDPGNLGTMIRAGEGAGVTGVVMDGSTADIYNPKVIRSTMGSVFRVPFLYVDPLADAVRAARQARIRLFAAHLAGAVDYENQVYADAVGFLIGNEANGLSPAVAALADAKIRIPMSGQVESLNAAVAASVLVFEAARQRRC